MCAIARRSPDAPTTPTPGPRARICSLRAHSLSLTPLRPCAPFFQGVGWALFFVAIGGEIGMLVALLYGMARHESTIVVATYYISMTLFASIQGLCVFDLLPQLDALSASGFTFGVLLCLAGVVWMAGLRAKDGGGNSPGSRRGSGVGGVDRSALIDGASCVVVEEAHGSGTASGEVGSPAIATSQNARPEPPQQPPSSEPQQMHSCEVG